MDDEKIEKQEDTGNAAEEKTIMPEPAKKERKTAVRKKKAEKDTATSPEHAAEQPKEASADKSEEKEAKATKKRKKKGHAVVARGKRKESIARATVTPGKGNLRINHMKLDAYYSNRYVREIARQPLNYLGPEALGIDIYVNVLGGGVMGQAQATRTAIANALVDYFPDQKLREKFLGIDRSLLVEDVRRVEPKKFKGPKARARFQKSYR